MPVASSSVGSDLTMIGFVVRRLLVLAGRRSRWVSRGLVLFGIIRWMNNKAGKRTVVDVPRGTTVVVTTEGVGQ